VRLSARLIGTLLLCVSAISVSALASQSAVVIANSAEVHQFANATSPLVGTLTKDTRFRMSSEVVRDSRGEYWYKMRIPAGEVGYIRAIDVRGDSLEQALKYAGVTAAHAPVDSPSEEQPWTFVARFMGLGGFYTGPLGVAGAFEAGGEGEFSMSLFPGSHGYLHRMVSVGVAVQAFSAPEVAVLGSFIYRFFSEDLLEPEIRLRVGDGLSSGNFLVGANAGVRYPFSLDTNALFCGYLEAGGLAAVTASVPLHMFVSAGLGYHF